MRSRHVQALAAITAVAALVRFSTLDLQTFAPQQVLVGMAVGGPWPGSPDATTPSPADMLVDWVQVYAR